ncbi:hypothetical protein IV417_18000 [Alphaproteobacteria bacterium KMM 3653]|uniref:Uncharacterized protein n=1 Tax=Harenicola maris TaxID=2841044 RepID=A0AAP2CVH6_9RHOB|nr:hypothetical protein [Harenicola maris]
MIWLLRKILIPAAALAFGWFAHADVAGKKCTEAGGTTSGGICRGVAQ